MSSRNNRRMLLMTAAFAFMATFSLSHLCLAADLSAPFKGITLGVSTFADVQRQFGKARIHRENSGDESAVYVCYASTDSNDDTLLFFRSGALGSWKVITSYVIGRSISPGHSRKECTMSQHVTRNVELAGLRLGMTREYVQQIAGPAGQATRTTLLYERVERSGEPPKQAEVKSGTRVTLDRDGKVTAIRVFKTTSF